jgi:hypothetical protein
LHHLYDGAFFLGENREENSIMKNNYHQINEHRERIGNTTFIIRSHINPAATETPEQLLLKLLESKIKNKEEQAA